MMSRSELFKTIARQQNFTDFFSGKIQQVFPVGPFQLTHEAYRGIVSNGIGKSTHQGLEMLVDIEYKEHGHVYEQTAYYYRDEVLSLPKFIIEPRHSFDFLSSLVGPKKHKTPLYPDFNKKYHVISPIKKFETAIINEQVYSFLSFEPNWVLEGNHNQLLMYQEDYTVPSDKLQSFLQVCRSIGYMLKGEKVL